MSDFETQQSPVTISETRPLKSTDHVHGVSRMTGNIDTRSMSTIRFQDIKERVLFLGPDPEKTILPLQRLREQLKLCQSERHRRLHLSSCSSNGRELAQVLTAASTLGHVDDVLRWMYGACFEAKNWQIFDHGDTFDDGASHASLDTDATIELASSQCRPRLYRSRSATKAKTISQGRILTSCTTGGTLKLLLKRTESRGEPGGNGRGSSDITISFIPDCPRSVTGISVQLRLSEDMSQYLDIPPVVRSLNVVSFDSPIIQSIVQNDLARVRKLFDERKASPQDVDPDGFSLLSVSYRSMGTCRTLLTAIYLVCTFLGLFRCFPFTVREWSEHA